jgi:hypothetical protein
MPLLSCENWKELVEHEGGKREIVESREGLGEAFMAACQVPEA